MVDNVKQHFRPAEASFIDLSEGYIRQVFDEYRPVLTNFLNPRQRYILETLVNQHDEIKMLANGGFKDAESQRVLLFPEYYEPELKDFEIAAIEINYPTKFTDLHHSTVLGTLMHAGIERDSVGDIVTNGNGNGIWQFVLTEPMARFVQTTLDHIGKVKVRFESIELTTLIEHLEEWEEIETTVAALRLDIIVANGYNISRTHAKEIIERGSVRVNWIDIPRPDYLLAVNDLISVRKYGRIKLIDENGLTKKDKWRITLAVIKK
ncbi:MAG: RNA-binding protein [Lactobacillaceae bacterium]|jgi:RNA-binding protein YlmH|nr:RNA-binding protein [Lactobacillaceae bacterium]